MTFHKGGGGLAFSKLMEMGGLKISLEKGGLGKIVVVVGGGGCLEMGRGLPYYIEIPHDAALKKNLDAFIFPLLTTMSYEIV